MKLDEVTTISDIDNIPVTDKFIVVGEDMVGLAFIDNDGKLNDGFFFECTYTQNKEQIFKAVQHLKKQVDELNNCNKEKVIAHIMRAPEFAYVWVYFEQK